MNSSVTSVPSASGSPRSRTTTSGTDRRTSVSASAPATATGCIAYLETLSKSPLARLGRDTKLTTTSTLEGIQIQRYIGIVTGGIVTALLTDPVTGAPRCFESALSLRWPDRT